MNSTSKTDNDNDPYGEVDIQESDNPTFNSGLGMKLYHAIALVGLVGGIFTLVWNIAEKNSGGVLFALVYMVLIIFGVFRAVPNRIHANDSGLNLYFWLKSPRFIPWSNIKSMRIHPGRGTWCYLSTNDAKYFVPIEFSGIKNSRILIRLIVVRSQLAFIRGDSFRKAYYERI